MELLLQRYSDNRDCTLGLLFKKIPGKLHFMCYTLEDEHRDAKVMHETRIPAGTYALKILKQDTPLTLKYRSRYQQWFNYHIEVTNVPNFTGVYIHIGNTDGDTSGCILVGDSADNNTILAGSISSSLQAFRRVYKEIYDTLESGKKVTLTIRDEKHLMT